MAVTGHIVLIGAGNVATRMGIALCQAGHHIIHVHSRSHESSSLLAKRLDCGHGTNISEIPENADLYLVAVADQALNKGFPGLKLNQRLVVHTSGSQPMDILEHYSSVHGVIYPLQTLSRERDIDFRRVPLCIEANTPENLERIKEWARTVSGIIYHVDSRQRAILHLAAVFACNFPNQLFHVAERILERYQLPFEMLRPLIGETAAKVQAMTPFQAQTGPALRQDLQVMEKHIELLRGDAMLQEIYRILSEMITQTHSTP
ncbi:MAG: DUF2520 domain-containing protein [Bacteroidales bacterium]|nr:DUF2520 domain-containing protein [Bacteroidales bacterium]